MKISKSALRLNICLALCCILVKTAPLSAQTSFPVLGLSEQSPRCVAFTHAEITLMPGSKLSDATIVVRDGIVENVGKNISIPQDAFVRDLQGATILPGFIDAYTQYGIKKTPPRPFNPGASPVYAHGNNNVLGWNEAVKPEVDVLELVEHDEKKAADWLEAGFTCLHVLPDDGIFRGNSAVILPGKPLLREAVIQDYAGMAMSFRKGSSQQAYPESLMGSIALIRQTLLDAEWYARLKNAKSSRVNLTMAEINASLEALLKFMASKRPAFFECGSWQDLFRVAAIAKEAKLPVVLKGGWDTYQRAEAIAKLGASLILSMDFPEPYDLSDPADVREVPLSKLQEWESAPRNPALMVAQKVPFAMTTFGQKKPKQIWESLAKAIRHGLTTDDALAALTTTPARILGIENKVGSLEPGKLANFVVYEEDPFKTCEPAILETWTAGTRTAFTEIPTTDLRGLHQLQISGMPFNLLITGSLIKPVGKLIVDKDSIKADIDLHGKDLRLSVTTQKGKDIQPHSLVGILNGTHAEGSGLAPNGTSVRWSMDRTAPFSPEMREKEKKPLEPVDVSKIPAPRFPALAYGNTSVPQEGKWIIQNATVWTNTASGILQNADVIIAEGKIKGVGKGLAVPPGATVVDGTNMHVTAGIIDEHSHIAIEQGVNEGSHAITPEVRIGDVLNSEDINIYRQLSGGVTAAQLLHGSANPIGGQSQIIKLRWGVLPEELKFAEAPGFVKFALGENVKQSNWGDRFRTRYPQTREGVEQIITDAFKSALNYKARKADAGKNPAAAPFRTDLQMEALLEIVESRRFVTCHSYVQSEILMLMRLAESFGFRINTFTHVLEGYKIAKEIKAHGASASSFSDWWAYKMEVYDAIPYNAAILHKHGVNVCLNSDDAEMARRLNQEAAKAVKYGGVSEEEALKMVTLNPAKALHVDHLVGSVEVGKQGDLVLWTEHPLSIYADAQMTFIDGKLYFDRAQDLAARTWIAAERERIIAKMASTASKEKRKPGGGGGPQLYECETLESDYNHED